jgi:leucyl-tRNA synthetase
MFPYPSGKLHLGHVRVYTFADILNRFHSLEGKCVFSPMGWDAFGLPAENAALKSGIDPETWTARNITTMKECLLDLNLNLDWEAEINTSLPDYYKWTQWLFLQLYYKGIAYQKHSFVNWDPVDKTVLANEQVDRFGRAERSGAKVENKLMKQWFLKITDYASRLYHDLEKVDWPAKVKLQQRRWIREQQGAVVNAQVYESMGNTNEIKIFIAECDFLKEPSRLVVGSRHPLAENWNFDRDNKEWGLQRMDNLQLQSPYDDTVRIPVFLSMDIPDQEAFLEASDKQRNSNTSFSDWLSEAKGTFETKYRLRDWLISRQRRWGTPIPIIHCKSCGPVPVPEEELPVILNDTQPIATCPKCGSKGTRETDTMDTFVDSSWYWARFVDSKNSNRYDTVFQYRIVDSELASKMLPVDIYIGGIEHSILHLLYARFIGKFMTDNHILNLPYGEPFSKLITVVSLIINAN